jgi:type I restriction enzyme R subunit
MTADEYDKVELPALEQLQALGWDYLHGSALAPDTSIARSSFGEPVLAARLTTE